MKLYIYGVVGRREATPDDIIEAFNDLTEWDRLRVFADYLDTLLRPALASPFAEPTFSSRYLRERAHRLEQSDRLEREDAKRDYEIEDLARTLACQAGVTFNAPEAGLWRARAKAIIDLGYRKVSGDE